MRGIRSFVMRAGRMSPRQTQGYEVLLAKYRLDTSTAPWNFAEIFGRDFAPTIIEIGFGMGASLVEMAKNHPDWNFIGMEVHKPGIGALAADIADAGLGNLKIAEGDAVEFFKTAVSPNSLAGIQIFFPDPWPKKRHHKRRIMQPEFLHLLTGTLQEEGFLHFATDWQEYAEYALELMEQEPALYNAAGSGFAERPDTRPITKFERRGQKLGHGVWDVICKKRTIKK